MKDYSTDKLIACNKEILEMIRSLYIQHRLLFRSLTLFFFPIFFYFSSKKDFCLFFFSLKFFMAEESDPFECRLTFLSLLQKLNASQQSIHKVANYAMRHRKLSEDLYSCLIEELEQVNYHFTA